MLTEYVKYYYFALSDEKRSIYRTLYEGFKNRSENIFIQVDVDLYSSRDIGDIAICVYNDTPSFYYLDISKFTTIKKIDGYIYSQNYIYNDAEIKEFDRLLNNGLRNFAKSYINEHMSDYEKEIVIHDYLVRSIKYDHEAIEKDHGLRIEEAYNVIGALLKKKAVCWGIACAFKLLCDYCGVKCFVMIGDVLPKQGDAGHAWNIVKLDDKEYHVDVTWDLKEKGDISFCYDYFNLNDKLIKIDHYWNSNLYPICTEFQWNYYYKNKLFVSDIKQVKSHVSRRLIKGEKYIAFKYTGIMHSEELFFSEIKKGFKTAKMYVAYRVAVSQKLHNIYIEVRGGCVESYD